MESGEPDIPALDPGDLAVHEQLLLLSLDDDKGTSRSSFAELALAGAVLVELVQAGAVEVVGESVRAVAGVAPAGPLAEAAAIVAAEPKEHDVRWWVERLPRTMKPLTLRLAERLIRAGVLTSEEHKVLWLFSQTRMPERDHSPEARVLARLRAVLLDEQTPSANDAVLAALVGAVGLVDAIVAKPDRKRAQQRAEALADADQVGTAVHAAVKAAQAALMASVVATTVAATVVAT